MRICNLGSLNIDLVYRVPHIARPGETIPSRSLATSAGGKGANQSVALARAGASVSHVGMIGADGRWLLDKLKQAGVDTSLVQVSDGIATGHAIIQVDSEGENAIVLHGGANHLLDHRRVGSALEHFAPGDVLLLQNEVNDVAHWIAAGHQRGMRVCFNPAPMTEAVRDFPLELIDLLIVNETEGEALSGERAPDAMLASLRERTGRAVLLTLGRDGAMYDDGETRAAAPGRTVTAVDTTAAGDTFIGYFLAGRAGGAAVADALERACAAAALCVTRPGAMDAIPTKDEV